MENRYSDVHVRNFRQVNDWLYRGGQPDEAGLIELRDFGIRTVISFRWRESINDWEREACHELGLSFFSIPLNYTNVPKAVHIEQFFALLDELEQRPMFVHCYHGSDRTGLMVGIYRIAEDGWTVDQAYKEMKACGFHRFRIRPFKWCLWQYYSRHLALKKNALLKPQDGM